MHKILKIAIIILIFIIFNENSYCYTGKIWAKNKINEPIGELIIDTNIEGVYQVSIYMSSKCFKNWDTDDVIQSSSDLDAHHTTIKNINKNNECKGMQSFKFVNPENRLSMTDHSQSKSDERSNYNNSYDIVEITEVDNLLSNHITIKNKNNSLFYTGVSLHSACMHSWKNWRYSDV